MAVVETLEIRFRADVKQFGNQLRQLSAQLLSLGKTLEGGKGGLADSASAMVEGVAEALRSSAEAATAPGEAGRLLAANFSAGISGGVSAASAAARQVSASARFSNASALTAARSVGANLALGFAGGISSKLSSVISAVNALVNAALIRLRSALKIKSPSRVTMEVGAYFGEGFSEGVQASLRAAARSAESLASTAAAGLSRASAAESLPRETDGLSGMMRGAVNAALGDTNLVLPLYVDGMKLGEASIRGINRVTRSAGRLMLEI